MPTRRLSPLVVAVLLFIVEVKCDCDPNCASACTSYPPCDSRCRAGYGRNPYSYRCEPCDLYCSQSSTCNTKGPGKCEYSSYCKSGYGLNVVTYKCEPCFPGCTSCSTNGPGKCDSCPPGMGRTANKTCAACDSNCHPSVSCDVYGAGKCDSTCRFGYGLTVSRNCAPCAPLCSNCTTAGAGKCDVCMTGNVLLPNKTCGEGACDPNCHPSSYCNVFGPGKCDTKCKNGYGIDSNHSCAPCDPNCDRSYSCNSKGPGRCDSICRFGYTLDSSYNCAPCAPGCSSCTDNGPGKCDSCPSGFALSANHTCEACPEGCSACNFPWTGKCDSCAAGYGMDASQTCGACDAYCNRAYTCNTHGPGKCDSGCIAGYHLDEDHTCKADLFDGYRWLMITLGIVAGIAVMGMGVAIGLLCRTHNAKIGEPDSHNRVGAGVAGAEGAMKTPQAKTLKAAKPAGRQHATNDYDNQEYDMQDVYEEFDTDIVAPRRY